MKHNFLILAFALLSSVQVAFSEEYSGTCGSNLNWSLDTITGAFVITGSGAMDSYTSSSVPWRKCKSYIKTISLPSALTSICERAFYNCDSITSVHIPDNVTNIGEAAFMDCDNLKSANIPFKIGYISKNQFSSCKNLTSIDIHKRIKSIGDGAFKGTGLISIYIPDSVSYIGAISDKYTPFSLCDNLKEIIVSPTNEYYCSVDGVLYNKQKTKLIHYPAAKENTTFTIPSSITYIGAKVFENAVNLISVTIPNSVTSIGYCSFIGCRSLTSINIPNSITTIGTGAFEYCTSLTSFEIPNSVTKIGAGAFSHCASLTSVVIPNSVTGTISAWEYCTSLKYAIIGDGVTSISGFNGCISLDSVVIGNNVTTIGEQAFYNCKSLTSINIPNSVTSIGSSIFRGCSNLSSVKMPDLITELPYASFEECSSLNAIDIPKSVTSIRSSAFSGCSSLDSVIIPYGVTTIEQSTFNNCKKLTHIEIPNSVTNIQMDAFSQCSGLQFLVLSDSVETISLRAFSGCNNLTICVPAKAATTSAFFNCKKVIYYTDHIGDYWFNDSTLTGYTGYETELELPYLHNGTTYSIGEHAFAKSNTPIISVIIPSAVTSIGNYAFGSVRTFKKVELPVNLTNIATNAFSGCDSIASVSMGLHESTPSIKTLFSSSINKSLKEFIALEGSTLVGTKKGGNNYQMFTNNRIIETIKIPYTVEVIADSTFMNCYNLKSITIGYKTVAEGEPENSPHHIKRHLLSEDNDTLRIYKVRIGDCEFQNDTSVTVLVLENGVEEIGYKAFENCRKLTNITIPNTVKSIGFQAFNKCSKLTDLALYCDFQALLKNGGSYGEQFRDCKSIKNIKLKQRRKIGTGELQPLTRVFASSLTSIESLEWINSSDTICWTDATSSDKMEDIPALRSVKLYEGITGIGNGAFKGSTLLTDIYLPLSLKHIGECAFMNCGIEDMYLFENVETIGKSTLANCANLKKLFIKSGKLEIIPASFCSNNPSLDTIGWPISSKIWAIGESAFANCTSLGVIHIRPSVTTIHSDAFNGCTSVYRLSSHAVTPPIFVDNIYTTTTSSGGLKGVNVENLEKFSVPHKSRNLYANADVWKKYWINGIAATFDENSTTLANNETTTETTPNSVNLSFADDADSYQLNIDGESYTVASYQNGNHQNPSLARRTKMEEGIPGIMFTLTGLKPNTEYSYTITAFDENKEILSVDSGYFWTQRPLYYAIRFLNWDGEILQTDSVESDSIPVYTGDIPTRPKDENYTYEFRGWSPTIVAATTDTDYIAQFDTIAIPYYTIRFLNWDGAVLQTMQVKEDSIPVYTGATPTRPADEKYTYEFSGWSPTIVAATTDTDYIAQFDSIAIPYYTIRFLNWNGAILQLTQVKEDDMPVYTGTTPTRPVDEQYTYEFSGWSPDIVVATADKDYTAQYTAHKKQVGWQTCGDNLLWKVEERALIITGFGDMWNYFPREEGYTGYAPWDTNITSVSLPDGLTGIGSDAFSGCADLTTIQLPNNLQKIEVGAFWNCLGLTTIDIPASVNYIGEDAFGACYGLTNINVDANNDNYRSIDGVLFDKAATTLLQYPFGKVINTYTIPNGVTTIEYGVFSYYYSNNVSIVIPSTVTNIGDYAFFDASLKSLTCEAATPPALGTDAFYGYVYSATLYVPGQSINTYKSTKGWKSFYKIQAIPVATGIEKEIHVDISPRENAKILRDGQIYILRGEKVYTITGQEVK